MRTYYVNLNNGKVIEVKLNTGETFKVDENENIIVSAFKDDYLEVYFYRRRTIY